jgi:hypothetical protein
MKKPRQDFLSKIDANYDNIHHRSINKSSARSPSRSNCRHAIHQVKRTHLDPSLLHVIRLAQITLYSDILKKILV